MPTDSLLLLKKEKSFRRREAEAENEELERTEGPLSLCFLSSLPEACGVNEVVVAREGGRDNQLGSLSVVSCE